MLNLYTMQSAEVGRADAVSGWHTFCGHLADSLADGEGSAGVLDLEQHLEAVYWSREAAADRSGHACRRGLAHSFRPLSPGSQ